MFVDKVGWGTINRHKKVQESDILVKIYKYYAKEQQTDKQIAKNSKCALYFDDCFIALDETYINA